MPHVDAYTTTPSSFLFTLNDRTIKQLNTYVDGMLLFRRRWWCSGSCSLPSTACWQPSCSPSTQSCWSKSRSTIGSLRHRSRRSWRRRSRPCCTSRTRRTCTRRSSERRRACCISEGRRLCTSRCSAGHSRRTASPAPAPVLVLVPEPPPAVLGRATDSVPGRAGPSWRGWKRQRPL